MKKSILIAEDELSLRLPLALKLEEEGFEVIQAGDGKIALEKALHSHPDLILLDIVMPVMDGLTMLKHLRDDEWGKTARVMIFTNLSDISKIAEAAEYDAKEYLVKSDMKLDDILQKIRDRLA